MAKNNAYREAERRIQRAFDSRSESLGLDFLDEYGDKLTKLPESLGQLSFLRNLYLRDNRLKALPGFIGRFENLRYIDLSGNQLRSLPRSLEKLVRLHTLDLEGNELTELPNWLEKLVGLHTLNLNCNQLSALPDSLRQLASLESLSLRNNQLAELPESLGQLGSLEFLDIRSNHLTTLPESLGRLVDLEFLELIDNQLKELPESLGHLVRLRNLDLQDNLLTSLPESFGQLGCLRNLSLEENYFHELPESLGQLTQLVALNLNGNLLRELPDSLGRLTRLQKLDIRHNPLNPDLAVACEKGAEIALEFLREVAKGKRRRYEAKLLILGDGNEGKTCVSRALRGEPFGDQPTTHGVDVAQWSFDHPDSPDDETKEITLNLWDFEGQEISHQTHQFFLTNDSLYLLVFKCRDQFQLDRAEYWLDTIRARAPEAKVAIVFTECETRTPSVPEGKLEEEYGDLLLDGKWLFGVGCSDDSGVPELRAALQRWAADLPFIGREWPDTYRAAEEALEKLAACKQSGDTAEGEDTDDGDAAANKECDQPHINRSRLDDILCEAQIDPSHFLGASEALQRIGVLTQFPDCTQLSDFIVLQPQWLTKGISRIMEDKQLKEEQGEIGFARMQQIWEEKDDLGKSYPGMFRVFHECMKEFELCYDLETDKDSCLVPLRFGYKQPQVPWSDTPDAKTRRVQYKLNIRPPFGLMSRFIVKTHHMIAASEAAPMGVYWHNGVFLRTGEGSLRSEALCEFDVGERTLSIEVRAAYPQNLVERIHAYADAVFAFFEGLLPVRSYGCIDIDPETNAELQCAKLHAEQDIRFALKSKERVACAVSEHHADPQQLIFGISSFASGVERRLLENQARILRKLEQQKALAHETKTSLETEAYLTRKQIDEKPAWAEEFTEDISKLLAWAQSNADALQQLRQDQSQLAPEMLQKIEQKLREYLGHMGDMLDTRERTQAPVVFSLNTEDGSKWNPKTYFEQKFILTPFCEFEHDMHPHSDGGIEFQYDKAWWRMAAPWIARGTKVLASGLQLAFAGMPLALGKDVLDAVSDEVDFMTALTGHLELEAERTDPELRDVLDRAGADPFPGTGKRYRDLRGDEGDTARMRAGLVGLLKELAPTSYEAKQWGELRRYPMPDNTYRWLCRHHAEMR